MSDLFPATLEVIELEGCIQKDNGEDWARVEGETFMADFFAFLEAHGLSFGGIFGGIEGSDGVSGHERWERLKAAVGGNKW